MSFRRFLEDYQEAFAESVVDSAKRQGLKIKGSSVIMPNGLDDKSLQLFIAYENQRLNKRLVWATWILVIGTLILSGLTLYFQIKEW